MRQHEVLELAVAADREPAELHCEDVEQLDDADDELRGGDPVWNDTTMMPWSSSRAAAAAPAIRPKVRPMTSSHVTAPSISSSSVAGRRAKMSSATPIFWRYTSARGQPRTRAEEIAPILFVERQVEPS